MKRSIFILVSATIALGVLASTPRLSRAQLKNVTIIKDDAANSLPHASRESSASPQTLGSADTVGTRIASADLYNFEWDDETGTATINETDYAMMGLSCKLTTSSSSGSEMYLSSFYGDFKIPFIIDSTTGVVRIQTGKALFTISNKLDGDTEGYLGLKSSNSLTANNGTYWTLYAMPVSWLMGDDDYDDIYGQVENNGTITFNDDFAFLVFRESSNGSSWHLSPIFRNLKLLIPNGQHKFVYTRFVPSGTNPVGSGHGGLVPRNTGSSKPVTPRPFSAIIGAGACLFGNHNPLTPNDSVLKTTNEVEPVYMYMADDTTLMVYNLFGQGNRCYMNYNPADSTIILPRQQIYNDGLGEVMYNTSSTCTWTEDSIMWGKTFGGPQYPEFSSNILLYTDDLQFGLIYEPVISYEVTDSAVIFTAATVQFGDLEAYLYMFDDESGYYMDVENPLTIPRLSESYWVGIAAMSYNPSTGECSDVVWFDYEVPALGVSVKPGDANADGAVNITDAIIMINALLNDNWEGINTNNADVDNNGSIDISDITKVINILLNDK